ncbi:apolipoprotein N-acyltransferase [Methylomonas paludis]|uniref:apolipoprotein N-acyltransferase n=1 Tax=Methylomonas paludis TaxID=1173101 RepID=UPI001FE432BE|nr:apolipoprotein N-acyltransferase [Methylomonas paludis]
MTPISIWRWLLPAPGVGALLTLAFAPYDYGYAAIPALMFIYRIWLLPTKYHPILLSYLFGVGLFAAGIWWVYISIHDFGGADGLSAIGLTSLLVGFWALFPALAGLVVVRLMRHSRPGWRVFAAAFVWISVEYLRGNYLLNGFPWLQIAYSQLNSPLAGYAPLVGVYGIGFLLAVSAFILTEVLLTKLSSRYIWLILAIWAGGQLLKNVAWTQAAGEPIKITLVQGNISQDQKWQSNQRLTTLQLYRHLTEQHWDSKVIIWPETAIPAFLSQVQTAYLDPLAAEARRHDTDLVVSMPSGGEGNQYFNSVLALSDKPTLYHKNHLLPFGEYLPLQPLSGWVLDWLEIPLGDFTAGADRQPLLTAGGYAFVTTICYEDAFGELVSRQIGDAGYIVNVTNDAWFGDSAQAFQHMQMAQMRALETGRYLVRVTNTGVTGFIGPDGKVRSQAATFTTTTLTDTIVPMSGITPYSRFGDTTVFAGLLALLGLAYAINMLNNSDRTS